MNIGLTYDLREDYLAQGWSLEQTAEFDRPDTIEAIEKALRSLGYQTDRIGDIKNLVDRLARGHRWDLVFNIAEGWQGFGREAQVPALLDAFSIPYTFSDPLVLALALHKGMAKRVIRELGIATADFAVVETAAEAGLVEMPFPLFAKPVAEGTSKGIDAASVIHDKGQLLATCRHLLEQFEQPVLIETFLPGREFTVGVIGTGRRAECVGVVEVLLTKGAEPEAYSYHNKQRYEEMVEYRRVDEFMARLAEELALAVWRGLGGRDAGRIDLRADERGALNFVEVNPLAGLHPIHSDLCIIARQFGWSYRDLIAAIVASAVERLAAAGAGAAADRRVGVVQEAFLRARRRRAQPNPAAELQ